jgi:hypothetical protein
VGHTLALVGVFFFAMAGWQIEAGRLSWAGFNMGMAAYYLLHAHISLSAAAVKREGDCGPARPPDGGRASNASEHSECE